MVLAFSGAPQTNIFRGLSTGDDVVCVCMAGDFRIDISIVCLHCVNEPENHRGANLRHQISVAPEIAVR